ncbi:ATP-binding protein [Leucobacter chromiireducens]|uniref:histidine kinase n=1 Tax=Leucobacter chromiireducens subsp. solipictus TaxID=398235 RepID=A0ABS1SD18_9MICO|nr:ATP-binding protein [Leucobacter chromiireducens]MBL3678424.1 histidine kinase [Leucobacter chromiireducens subsp. solipictus]
MTRVSTPRGVRLALLFLPTVIVCTAVAVTASIAFAVQERSIRAVTADRVSDVASSLAELAQVRDALGRAHEDRHVATRDLQPLATVVERAAGVDYVVISDEEQIRITHPTPAERGERLSTDNSTVLAGEPFLGTETGTIGQTLRAKVPVRDASGEVIGALSVGILESRIDEDYARAFGELVPWVIGALLAGTLASSAIAALWERRFRRLDEAARDAAELRRTAAALREQSHEFHTRLHVIHGLVAHGDTGTALSYIDGIAPVTTGQEEESLPDQPLLRATVDVLRAELGAHGARLETELRVESEVDEEVTLVLANLCRNAGEAGATVVRCALTEHDGRYFGEVADNGTGVAAEEAERVFTRGVSSKRDASGFGRGMGLELVRRTVASRGGTVELGRADLGGARFRFEMRVIR